MGELFNLRKQIDNLDENLLQIISERMSVVKKIGMLKKKNNLPALDTKRLREIQKSTQDNAKKLNLSKSFVQNLFNLIHKLALEIEKED